MTIFASSKNPKEVFKRFKEEVKQIIKTGIDEKTFIRTKNKIYGRLVTSYNSAPQIARIFMRDYLNNIITFDYVEKWKEITIEDVNTILRDKFDEERMILSVVSQKNN